MLQNTQPIERQVAPDVDTIEVHSIFDTLQGEGPYTGMPSTFVRLAGCDLNCRLCDTDYTSNRVTHTVEDLVKRIEAFPVRGVVVITGGEPFRQNIVPLIRELVLTGRKVQIETNGTLYHSNLIDLGCKGENGLTIVCSPKTQKIPEQMWKWIDELKYVVEDGFIDTDGLPLKSVGPQYGRPARPPAMWHGQIYVQPLDHQDPVKNAANAQAAVNSCLEHGYRLCLQIQKIVNLP